MKYRFPVLNATQVVAGYRTYMKPRWKWLEKLMRKCRLLVDDYDPIMRDTYETFDITDDDVMMVLRRGLSEVARYRYEKPSCIFIGVEYFDALCRDMGTKLNKQIMMPFKAYGARIYVTPYLEGILPVWEDDYVCR